VAVLAVAQVTVQELAILVVRGILLLQVQVKVVTVEQTEVVQALLRMALGVAVVQVL
jgi:hypothetical protein